MKKEFKLICSGSRSYSLSNVTDSDILTDYFAGVWGVSTQKQMVEYVAEELANGHAVNIASYGDRKRAEKVLRLAREKAGKAHPISHS